jgi:hypothetical protein
MTNWKVSSLPGLSLDSSFSRTTTRVIYFTGYLEYGMRRDNLNQRLCSSTESLQENIPSMRMVSKVKEGVAEYSKDDSPFNFDNETVN